MRAAMVDLIRDPIPPTRMESIAAAFRTALDISKMRNVHRPGRHLFSPEATTTSQLLTPNLNFHRGDVADAGLAQQFSRLAPALISVNKLALVFEFQTSGFRGCP
jgi:hypothetical protein